MYWIIKKIYLIECCRWKMHEPW